MITHQILFTPRGSTAFKLRNFFFSFCDPSFFFFFFNAQNPFRAQELLYFTLKTFISQVREKDKAKNGQEWPENQGEGMKKGDSSFKAKNFQVMLMLVEAPCGSGKRHLENHVAYHKNIMKVKLQKSLKLQFKPFKIYF